MRFRCETSGFHFLLLDMDAHGVDVDSILEVRLFVLIPAVLGKERRLTKRLEIDPRLRQMFYTR